MSQLVVRPDVRRFLDILAANPRPVFNDTMMKQIRQIALRLFDPRKHRGAGPVVVFYHGGGFVVGSIGTHAELAAIAASRRPSSLTLALCPSQGAALV